jgi:hypothetical protein
MILTQYRKFKIPHTLIDDGAGVNLCPMMVAIKLGIDPEDITLSSTGVRAFDGAYHDVLGIINLPLQIGPAKFDVPFHVTNVSSPFNLLLGRPWIHQNMVLPSTLFRMLKFWWEDYVVVILAEDFERTSADEPAISAISMNKFQPSSNTIYVDRYGPTDGIPPAKHITSVSNGGNPSQMIKSLYQRWGYTENTPLGKHAQGISEPIQVMPKFGKKGLGYQEQGTNEQLNSKKPTGLDRFVSVGIMDPNQSHEATSTARVSAEQSSSPNHTNSQTSQETDDQLEGLSLLFREMCTSPQEPSIMITDTLTTEEDPVDLITTDPHPAESNWYILQSSEEYQNSKNSP